MKIGIIDLCKQIEDPRMNRKKVHKMETIIYISIAAVICGAQSWNEIEEFGNAKIAFFKSRIGNIDRTGAEIMDCTGKYIMPGLINMHAHLFGTGMPSKVLGGGGSQKAVLKFVHTQLGHKVLDAMVASHVLAELDSGVTTLRAVGDFCGSDLRIRDAVRAGQKIGPGPTAKVPK